MSKISPFNLPYILQLVSKGENEVQDFKRTISSASKIAKTMVAFANGKGGTLLVGINDNRTLAGVKSEDEKYMLDLAAHFYCRPEINIELTEWEQSGKTILECYVPEGNDKPYYSKDEDGKWWVHVRVNDKTLQASKIMVEVLKRHSDKTDTLIKYSEDEQALLNYLARHGRITLKEVCKFFNLSRWKAQKMIINLASAHILSVHLNEKEEYFTLS